MYKINDQIEINLKHVERVERNTHRPHLIIELVSGKSVVKEFADDTARDAECVSISSAIDVA